MPLLLEVLTPPEVRAVDGRGGGPGAAGPAQRRPQDLGAEFVRMEPRKQ